MCKDCDWLNKALSITNKYVDYLEVENKALQERIKALEKRNTGKKKRAKVLPFKLIRGGIAT